MRFVFLDLIRSIAISLILLFHISFLTGGPLGGRLFTIGHVYQGYLGNIAVTMFLILSGLVLELNYKSRLIAYGRFMAQRILRIYPTYYLTLILCIVFQFGGKYYFTDHFPDFSVLDLIGSVSGFYAFLGRWGGPFVKTSWFIGPIITMYLMYPYISKGIRRHPNIAIILLLFVSILSRSIIGQYSILPKNPLE